MPITVELPDRTEVEFPDGMDESQISAEIARLFPDLTPKQSPSLRTAIPEPDPGKELQSQQTPPSTAQAFPAKEQQAQDAIEADKAARAALPDGSNESIAEAVAIGAQRGLAGVQSAPEAEIQPIGEEGTFTRGASEVAAGLLNRPELIAASLFPPTAAALAVRYGPEIAKTLITDLGAAQKGDNQAAGRAIATMLPLLIGGGARVKSALERTRGTETARAGLANDAAIQSLLARPEPKSAPPVIEFRTDPGSVRTVQGQTVPAPRPTVPETAPEPQRGMSVIQEIRQRGADTKEKIRALFPHLTREDAAALRDQAFPRERQPDNLSKAQADQVFNLDGLTEKANRELEAVLPRTVEAVRQTGERTQDASGLREDAGQVPQAGAQPESRQAEGSANLERQAQEQPGGAQAPEPVRVAEEPLPSSSGGKGVPEATPTTTPLAAGKVDLAAEPPSGQALGAIPPVPQVVKDVGQTVGRAMDAYSQPLTERLAAEGGTASKGFANMAQEMVNRSKALYGELTPILDPALEATGKLNNTTTWLNNIAPTTEPWGYRNAVEAVEGPIGAVPAQHLPTVQKLRDANLAIGQMAMKGVPGFVASGKYQRQPTPFLVDTIRAGKGPARELLVRALSRENKIPEATVRQIFEDIKAEFDKPGSKQTIHRISQEFDRAFKKFPTDLKIRGVWVPILHAKPFAYLSSTALNTAQRVAFLERVPQGTLDQLRTQVVSELKDPAAFDDLVRTLHGLSVDEPWRLVTPGTKTAMALGGVNQVLGLFGQLKLTASAIFNIPETVIGNTPAFYGWRNFFKGIKSLPAKHQALEQMGAINRAIYDWSFDPKAPIRSVLAEMRNGIRKTTLQQFFNEIQEKLAASTADVFAQSAQSGKLTAPQQAAFVEAAVAEGFARPAAKAMAQGLGSPEQYADFTRRASAFVTGGNLLKPEQSRLGANRLFSSLFRFQSYPMMKLNAFRKALGSFADAVESGEAARIKASSNMLAKFLFNTTAQGAAATFLASLLTGRNGGVANTAEDATDSPGGFLLDSVITGMGGPAAVIYYAARDGRLAQKLDPRNINLGSTFPGAIALELHQMFNRKGQYAGMTLREAAQKYAQTKIPAGRVIVNALRETGLLDTADDSQAEVYQMIRRWREKSDNPKVVADRESRSSQTFGESDYAALRQALKVKDRSRARKEYRKLLETKDRKTIRSAMTSEKPFTGSLQMEREFLRSLSASERKAYRDAQAERKAIALQFKALGI